MHPMIPALGVVVLFLLLSAAFITMSVNPATWPVAVRFVVVILIAVAVLTAISPS